jgi:hypothetical protein
MSIHEITIGEFIQLDPKQLQLAVRLCDQEIKALQLTDPGAPDYEQVLDEIASAITLRKVHKTRLDELTAESTDVPTGTLASQQYQQNALAAA